MRTTQLRAFDAVARHGSFSAAAERLSLTQPAVTIQVRALEDGYGTKLFDRRGGGVTLTAAGQGLFERTQVLFAAEEQVRSYLDRSQQLHLGALRLSTDSPPFAMALIARFRARYPGVVMSVGLGNTPKVWGDLMEGAADVVIVANPPGEPRAQVTPLGYRGLRVLLPAGHALSGRTALALPDLGGLPCIFREAVSNTQKALNMAMKKNRVQLDQAMQFGSREAVIEAVASGLGIGFVFAGEVPGDRRVVEVPLAGLEKVNRDTVACLKSQRHRNSIQAFLTEARAWQATRQSGGQPAR